MSKKEWKEMDSSMRYLSRRCEEIAEIKTVRTPQIYNISGRVVGFDKDIAIESLRKLAF